jgi:hypothetical protein
MNMTVVSADNEYLCMYNEKSPRPKNFGVYQVATYDACAFRMSTIGTLPTGTPFDTRIAASPA